MASKNKLKTLIIIPAFNEEKSIIGVIFDCKKYQPDADVLVINDCSKDETPKRARDAGANVINLPINLGIGGAMQTGYLYAKENNYDKAIQVDGDGQHNPEEIKKLLEGQEKDNAGLVIGSRFVSKSDFKQTMGRMLGIQILSFLSGLLTGQRVKDVTSGFRLADRTVIKIFADYYPSDYPEPEVIIMLKKKGIKVVEIPVKMNLRKGGVSSITPLKSIYYMIKVMSSMLIQKLRG